MGARILLIAFATFLLFTGSNSIAAQSTCTALPSITAFNIGISPLFSVYALALMLSFLVIAIGFIISKSIPGTKLDSWLKGEFWEVSKSVMLIAGSIGILVFVGNISMVLIGQPGIQNSAGISSVFTSLSTSASSVLCNIYLSSGSSTYSITTAGQDLVGLSEGLGIMRSMTIGWWIPIPIGTIGAFTFGSTFGIYNNPMLETDRFTGQYESALNDDLQFLLIPMGLLIVAQYYLLPLIIYIGLMVLMPIGILFRAFPFLRGIGGTLFAFGIGLAVVYPTLIIALNMPVNNIISQYVVLPQTQPSCNINGILGVFICGISNILQSLGISSIFQGIGTAAMTPLNIYDGLNITTPAFMYLFAQFILFIFDLMIAYPLIDSIAKALGGTIRMNIGGRLGVR